MLQLLAALGVVLGAWTFVRTVLVLSLTSAAVRQSLENIVKAPRHTYTQITEQANLPNVNIWLLEEGRRVTQKPSKQSANANAAISVELKCLRVKVAFSLTCGLVRSVLQGGGNGRGNVLHTVYV